jgi:hypothetical protein
MKALSLTFVSLVCLSVGAAGCSASLAAPFDTLKKDNAPMTVFRLQNFEPPAAAPGAPAAGPIALPPQIQQWITGAAQLLPPGLLPPGLIPGSQAPAATAQVPRFHEFRILGSVNVADRSIHDEMMEILGKESNFETPRESCMYAEFGVAIAQLNQPPADILISLSCHQVRTFGFVWPHGQKTGLKPETSKKIVEVMKRTFGG